jgi:thiol-disulfide isomerase/thioredoxin
VVVGLIGLVNVLLLAAVLRRLREQEQRLSTGVPAGQPVLATLPAGGSVGAFSALSTQNRPVDSVRLLAEPVVAGFFSSSCGGCRGQLEGFASYAKEYGPERVLAVVSGDAEEGADLLAALEPVATVVLEPVDGPVASAFGVTGAPVFAVVDPPGHIRSFTGHATELPAPLRR